MGKIAHEEVFIMSEIGNHYDNNGKIEGEIKGIQESLLTVLDVKFQEYPNNITSIINSQNNVITLKGWLTRITSTNTIDEVTDILSTKTNI